MLFRSTELNAISAIQEDNKKGSWFGNNSNTAVDRAQREKEEANQGFAKYIAKNYLDWVSPDNRDRHLMSPDIFKRKIQGDLKEFLITYGLCIMAGALGGMLS